MVLIIPTTPCLISLEQYTRRLCVNSSFPILGLEPFESNYFLYTTAINEILV